MKPQTKHPGGPPGAVQIKVTQEYLRRNLQVARAEGAKANAKSALAKLCAQKRPPKWLIEALEGIIERVEGLPKDLAAYRDLEREIVPLQDHKENQKS